MFTEEERTEPRGEVHCLRQHSSRQRSELEARQGPGLLWLERVGLVEWRLFTSPGSEGPSGGDIHPSSLAWEPCGRGHPGLCLSICSCEQGSPAPPAGISAPCSPGGGGSPPKGVGVGVTHLPGLFLSWHLKLRSLRLWKSETENWETSDAQKNQGLLCFEACGSPRPSWVMNAGNPPWLGSQAEICRVFPLCHTSRHTHARTHTCTEAQ